MHGVYCGHAPEHAGVYCMCHMQCWHLRERDWHDELLAVPARQVSRQRRLHVLRGMRRRTAWHGARRFQRPLRRMRSGPLRARHCRLHLHSLCARPVRWRSWAARLSRLPAARQHDAAGRHEGRALLVRRAAPERFARFGVPLLPTAHLRHEQQQRTVLLPRGDGHVANAPQCMCG